MSTKEEVLKIGKKLEKLIADNAADHSSAGDLLKTLKSTNITLDVLQKTHIGLVVNNLRKAAKDEEVITLSKNLIKAWKKLVPDGGGQGDGPARRCSSTSARSTSTASATSDIDDTMSPGPERRRSSVATSDEDDARYKSVSSENGSVSRRESSENGSVPRRESSENGSVLRRESTSSEGSSSMALQRRYSEQDGEETGAQISPPRDDPPVEVDDTSDPARLKCRELLGNALRTPSEVEGGCDYDRLAAEIEQFVYKQFDNTDMKYKNRVRSLITNLKDTKNPRLRENVLLGHISPKRFSMMTPEEMASDEMKKLREKLSKEAFNDHQMAVNSGTKSDLFKCSRCGQRNTTYNQLQTRSSDEPMTTFVLCNECGNRWKFC